MRAARATRPFLSGRLSSGAMIRSFLVTAVAALLFASCSEHSPKTLGTAVQGGAIPIASAQQIKVNSEVILHGTMIEKCPVAGCWFILQDPTGTIKVDTKNAGFVVVEVPINTSLAVAGRVTTNGAERIIDAIGVRY